MNNHSQNNYKIFRVRYKPKINLSQIIGITSMLLALSVALMQLNNVLAHFTEYRLSKVIVILPLVTLLIFWFTVYFQSKYSYSKIQRTKAILHSVIEMNKLYFINPVTKEIDLSMVFHFYFTETKLVIQAYAFGASYTKKADDLGEIFESVWI
ncbi:hypothetical protein ACH0BF_09795 [Pseudobacillus sp. 179-B 2D1 NHS]|uniref:hypothetical protein n=1 Tax=Pseudobacillus sp. 179-B 2D1 NHS TaxID=3374292 RepID=UPI0038793745